MYLLIVIRLYILIQIKKLISVFLVKEPIKPYYTFYQKYLTLPVMMLNHKFLLSFNVLVDCMMSLIKRQLFLGQVPTSNHLSRKCHFMSVKSS